MLAFKRLAKEDYLALGNITVWTLWDALALLTSFEMESIGAFGETEELLVFDRVPLNKVLEGPEKVYHDTWKKWGNLLTSSFRFGVLLYANIPSNDNDFESPPSAKSWSCDSSMSRGDLFRYLSGCVAEGRVSIDLSLLPDYLRGKGRAPVREFKVEEKIVEKIVEVEKFVEKVVVEKKTMTESDMGAGLARNKNKVPKGKVRTFVEGQFEQGCTCFHVVMREHVQKHFKSEEKECLPPNEKERVTRLSKDLLLKTIREIYSAKGKEFLIFDKSKTDNKTNSCKLHPSSK